MVRTRTRTEDSLHLSREEGARMFHLLIISIRFFLSFDLFHYSNMTNSFIDFRSYFPFFQIRLEDHFIL